MIKVAFPVLGGPQWWAGITYLSNLLYAISVLEDRKILPVLIQKNKGQEQVLDSLKPYADSLAYSKLTMSLPLAKLNGLLKKFSDYDMLLDRFLRKNGVHVISHVQYPIAASRAYKSIAWIPDFQHIHLPAMFSPGETAARNRNYTLLGRNSDVVVLSSNQALQDFTSLMPGCSHKARILHFVSQPNPLAFSVDRSTTEQKFGLDRKYFYLPNQFWKHKNHVTVFQAVKQLKEQGQNVQLVCSGALADYRNKEHIQALLDFIRQNNLEGSIRLLGLIDQVDVFSLMRNCVSIINPSLFEGWSTTVEEAKSIGKNVILSDIPVHREQNPPDCVYFQPLNVSQLADILMRRYIESSGGPDADLEERARQALHSRTVEYGRTYQSIVLELMQG